MERILQLIASWSTQSQEFGKSTQIQVELKELCNVNGIPDSPESLRGDLYQIILNVPSNSIELYSAYVEEVEKRVLNLASPSKIVLKEDKLILEIERDVIRTFGELAWFSTIVETKEEGALFYRLRMLRLLDSEVIISPKLDVPSLDSSPDLRPITHRDILVRPLFIYAILNPEISYVQGFNSILAVLFFVFSKMGNDPSMLQAEAAAFFALGSVLSPLADLYQPAHDQTVSPVSTPTRSSGGSTGSTGTGLLHTMNRFKKLLEWLDPELAQALRKIDPTLYAFRWISTFFSNELDLPDLLRVWDRILSVPEEGKVSFILDVSLSIVLMERPRLIDSNSSSRALSILQTPQILDVDRLLAIASEIKDRRLGTGKPKAAEQSDWKLSTATAIHDRFFGSPIRSRTESNSALKDDQPLPPPPPPSHSPELSRSSRSSLPDFNDNESDSEEETGPSISTRFSNSYQTWISSDRNAQLSKAVTNLTISAQDRVNTIASAAPGTLSKIKEDLNAASAASAKYFGGSNQDVATRNRRLQQEVHSLPFTPPSSSSMNRNGSNSHSTSSNGQRTLLLARSARRTTSEGSNSPSQISTSISPVTKYTELFPNENDPSPSPSTRPSFVAPSVGQNGGKRYALSDAPVPIINSSTTSSDGQSGERRRAGMHGASNGVEEQAWDETDILESYE